MNAYVLLRPRHGVHGQIYLQADDDGGQLEFTYVTAKGDLGLSHLKCALKP